MNRVALVVALALSVVFLPDLAGRGAVHGEPLDAAALRARGIELGYNLDHAEALAVFRRAVDADPGAAASHRLLAGAAWTKLLFDQGAIAIDDYLGEARARYERPAPDADLARTFHDAVERAVALAEQQLRDRPDDAAAHYLVGAVHGYRAAYAATIDGQLSGSLGSARRAYREHQRVLELDPSRKDAGLIVGMYRYAVAALPLHLRFGAYLAGFGGGRDRGLRLVEDAAAYPSEVRSNAQFVLVLLYNRELRFDDALRVIRGLRREFPRNRLLWLEEGGTALRAGRPAEARAALEEGLARLARDPRPRAPGEEARWRLAHGSALVALHDTTAAVGVLRTALVLANRDWLRGRTHRELGKVADLEGRRADAIEAYRRADRLCRADADRACSDEARALMKGRYR
jgi:tetratricopeptide (TPR) repeat protein